MPFCDSKAGESPFEMTPCACEYKPVRKEARLGPQSAFVTKASVKRTPPEAMRSMFGVRRRELP